MSDLEFLYHQQMIALTQTPEYKQDTDLENQVTLRNPMCGDVISMGYNPQNQVHWHGEGCLICCASAEALCQTIAEPADPHETCRQIQDFFEKDTDQVPEKFLPLASVKMTQSRVKCVLLAINTLKKLLTDHKAL